MSAPPNAIAQLALFFGIMTPGDEKALREGFKMEPNPKLEDVAASPHATSDESAALLLRARDRIRQSFPDHVGGG